MEAINTHDLSVEERRERTRKLWRNAYIGSFFFHLLVFLIWQSPRFHNSPFAAAGERNGDPVAAAGGMQAVTMVVPPTQPIIPPPIPIPSVDVQPMEFSEDPPQLEEASFEGMNAGLEGPGIEDGEGQGDGGNSDEGLYQMVPATPRSMIIPPSDEDLKGKTIEVWLFVDIRGRVVADSTYLRPGTGNGGLDRRLIADAAEWLFRPARQGGEPIAAWTTYSMRVGG